MKEKKYILSLVVVYLCYFTHGMQAIILQQNKANFFTQWGYTDEVLGAAAVSLVVTATGFGKLLTVWIGGEISDKIGRKVMAVAGGVLYVICFALLYFSTSFTAACVAGFLMGVATSGFWDASLYPAVQEAVPKYSGSALVGIKLFVSISGIIYPLLVVYFADQGNWKINILIPLVLSIVCVVVSVIARFAYDDELKTVDKKSVTDKKKFVDPEVEKAKARQLVPPNTMVQIITMAYGFLCMFIMFGAQQYTKAFGMNSRGLSEMQAAGLTSIYTAGSIVAVIFWAIMMGKLKWNPLKVVLIDSIFTAVALVITLLVQNVMVVYVAIALLGFFAAGGALQTGLGVRQLFCPGPKGRNTGIYYTFMSLASCFLPYIVSAMTKSIGEAAAVNTMMGLLLAAAVICILAMSYLVVQHKKMYGVSALKKAE
ncbi:MFS family permease [Aequitasia blattaphilus]|uniref:MFS transporter n=1 Tax=Aequitasia blattaphilus TaxID=2949332 RepID=A0ABT1E4T8_9FIRM|nr:MFS transporter [Aequitasia blattaphilus]MCP1100845.1 MFS transporter [Aequitasia blattaphilus]MCR8613485.1 MFS transporter [Aequitasia blattaphilus]